MPEEDARFTETDTGDWTDRSFAEIQAEDPEGFHRYEISDPAFRYPGGESFAEQSDRVQAGLRDLRAAPRTCRRSSSATAASSASRSPSRPATTPPAAGDRQRDPGDRVSRICRLRVRRARARDLRRVLRRPAPQGDAVGRRRVPPHAVLLAQPRRPLRPRDGPLRDPQARPVSLAVVDADGDEVKTLIDDDTFLPYREIRARWDGTNDDGDARPRRQLPLPDHARRPGPQRRHPGVGAARHDAAAAAGDVDRPARRTPCRGPSCCRSRAAARPIVHLFAPGQKKKILLFKTGPGPVRQVGPPVPLDDGATEWRWSGQTETGRPVSPGTYLVAIQVRDQAGNIGTSPPLDRRGLPAITYGSPLPGRGGITVRYLGVQPPAAPVQAGKPVAFGVDPRGERWAVHGPARRLERDRRARRAHPRRGLPDHRAGPRVRRLPLRRAHPRAARDGPVRGPGRREAPGARRPADDDVAGPQPGRRRWRRLAEPPRHRAARPPRPRARRRRPARRVRPARRAAARLARAQRAALRRDDRRRPRRRQRPEALRPQGRAPDVRHPLAAARAAAAPAELRPRRRHRRLAGAGLAAPRGARDAARAAHRPDPAGADRPLRRAPRPADPRAGARDADRGHRPHRALRRDRRPVPGLGRPRAARRGSAPRPGWRRRR